MTTYLHIAVATVAMTGLASAQPKADPAKKAEPAKTEPAKADPKAAAGDKKPAMEMPKVPTEIADMAKSMTGSWRCKGDEWDPTGAKNPLTATIKSKVDLDKWWISDAMEVKGKNTFRMQAFTTYDAASKKWRRVAVDNWGGQMVGTSDGMKDSKMDWNSDTISPMGAGMFRDHVDATDAKAGVKFWGEMSMDKGKTWVKVYEMACKK